MCYCVRFAIVFLIDGGLAGLLMGFWCVAMECCGAGWILVVVALIVLVFVVSFGIWFSVGVVYSVMLVWCKRLCFDLLLCVFILA